MADPELVADPHADFQFAPLNRHLDVVREARVLCACILVGVCLCRDNATIVQGEIFSVISSITPLRFVVSFISATRARPLRPDHDTGYHGEKRPDPRDALERHRDTQVIKEWTVQQFGNFHLLIGLFERLNSSVFISDNATKHLVDRPLPCRRLVCQQPCRPSHRQENQPTLRAFKKRDSVQLCSFQSGAAPQYDGGPLPSANAQRGQRA